VNYTSFEKGEEFEKFVENELFSEKEYNLIHRTNNFEQNKSRYSEDTLKPDFKFRCKKTFQEFYVEAKYRSKFNSNDMIEIMSIDQLERFKGIQESEGIPIYIVVGYIGNPSIPDNISLIPLSELIYLKLYPSFLRKFEINKEIVNSKNLNLWKNKKTNDTIKNEKEFHSKISSKFYKKKKFIITISILVLTIIGLLSFNLSGNNNIEKELRQKITQYYNTFDSGNVNDLDFYINPIVDKWYTKTNISISEIKSDASAYLKKYPNTQTEIQWNSFKVKPLNDDYAVTYKMIYKILNSKKNKTRIYHLEIKAVWDKNLKLKSMYEVKI
jgi:hypothetical protein